MQYRMFNVVFAQGDKAKDVYIIKNGDFLVKKQVVIPKKLDEAS